MHQESEVRRWLLRGDECLCTLKCCSHLFLVHLDVVYVGLQLLLRERERERERNGERAEKREKEKKKMQKKGELHEAA